MNVQVGGKRVEARVSEALEAGGSNHWPGVVWRAEFLCHTTSHPELSLVSPLRDLPDDVDCCLSYDQLRQGAELLDDSAALLRPK